MVPHLSSLTLVGVTACGLAPSKVARYLGIQISRDALQVT